MSQLSILLKYFPDLSEQQLAHYNQFIEVFCDWNEKINLISRKDIDNLVERHILHCLGIAKFIRFVPGTKIIDVGTGGGFPGIPLAIFFPDSTFLLIDSIKKKIGVVQDIIQKLGLKNASSLQIRSNELRDKKFDFVISRAVSLVPKFYEETIHLIQKQEKNGLPNGIIYLKGGDVTTEIEGYKRFTTVQELSTYFKLPFFDTKKIVYIQS